MEVTAPRNHVQSPHPSEAPLPPPRSHLIGHEGVMDQVPSLNGKLKTEGMELAPVHS